jgi:hypothetical protein
MKFPKVIGQIEGTRVYLVQFDDEEGTKVSMSENLALGRASLQSILKTAPWIEFDGDDETERQVLALAAKL